MRLGYQQTVIDTYAKVAFAKLYDRKTPITAAEILNDRVVPLGCDTAELEQKKERRPLAPLKSWLDLEELTPTAAHRSEADQRGTKQRQSSRLWHCWRQSRNFHQRMISGHGFYRDTGAGLARGSIP